jgi:energy-coupling factor transporter ATP-binding protein EcfA2
VSLTVIGIQIENFQKIRTFLLKPEGNVIKITGANGSGKTSVLDAIMLALAGARGGPSAPVRRGAGRGVVRLDLGDIRVTRTWFEGGDSKGEMFIEAEDGRRYGTPQRMLDALMGEISFDPLAFIHMDVKRKAEELRKLLNIDDVLNAIRADEENDYTTRREQTKLKKTLEAQRANVHVPEGLPAKKRDIDAMTEELAKVAEYNIGIERMKLDREKVEASVEKDGQTAENLRRRIEDITKELHQMILEAEMLERSNAKHKAIIDAWEPLPEPKDATAMGEEIAAARGINAGIDRRSQAERMDAEIAAVSATIANLDDAIDAHRAKATKLIAEAEYPVEGLGFENDEVMYNGLPFAQASNAEQIKVSIAMGMALNPKIRVMRIKDGSLLDANSLAVVEAMAEKSEFQVWMELVDTSGKVGVYLEDGEIAAIDGEVREPLQLKPTLAPARKRPTKKVKEGV